MKLYIYSGECRFCEVGLPTQIKDDCENMLRTGDIVMSYTTSELGIDYFDGLTVVVADHFENYQGQEPQEMEDKGKPFVMGIKSVSLTDDVWRVRRLKGYEDVINGEHWKDFGFSFRGGDR